MATEIMTRDGELVEQSSVIGELARADIDTQIATAHAYPRSITDFQKESFALATLNDKIASECIYAIKRGGKVIEGPSVRFAEITLSTWGNCQAGSRVVSEDDQTITCQGIFKDLQRNVVVTKEVRRRITYKDGRRYNDDMIQVASNAGCAIAIRNAILAGIPQGFWRHAYDAAKERAIGDAEQHVVKRQKIVDYFQKMGIDAEQIATHLEIPSIELITPEHVTLLRTMAQQIKDGETTVDEAFGLSTGGFDIKVLQSELEKCESKTDVKALKDVFGELAETDDDREYLDHACDEREMEIAETRGEKSNAK
jgi:hypothetical protein